MSIIAYDADKLFAGTIIEQGTPEWHQARLGKATASRVSEIIATISNGYAASRKNYMAELIAERLTGVPAEKYTNAAMAWGTEKEPDAREAYRFYRRVTVQQVGFINHPAIPMAGCSPDGLVGQDGLVEIKCPSTATHIETRLGKAIKSEHLTQMQFQMAVTSRAWCDYVSFDPRLPENMRLHVQTVKRDDTVIGRLEREVKLFLGEVEETIRKLEAGCDE